MCVMSAVMEWYDPYIPRRQPLPNVPTQPYQWPQPGIPRKDLNELRELIDSFKDAVKAAEVFDRLTGQPDCVDPEKAELVDRVDALEARLAELEAA